MRTLALPVFGIFLATGFAGAALAQSTTTTTTTTAPSTTSSSDSTTSTTSSSSSYAAQQAAIQSQITQGIESGNLSQEQIGQLQAQQDRLTSARAAAAGGGVNGPSYNNGITDGRTSTGPDPFTYNTLGPDAYQAQKNQNPGYNVPAYPTTNPTSLNTTQQYNAPAATGPASETPQVGTYYGNNGVNGGSGGVATATPGATGTYVYQTGMSRR